MSCPNCTCSICRQDPGRWAHRRKLGALCASWEWNATPAEAREELQKSGFDPTEVAVVMREMLFPEEQIRQVTGD